jgi:transposase InsO family protein
VRKGAGPRRKKRAPRRRYTPDEKRATVEAFQQAGRSRADFAALWGISPYTLARWLLIHEREGPHGFEPKPRAPRKREDPRRLSKNVRAEIARTKKRFPAFGLRKVRDFLARFSGIRVSVGSVHRTLHEEGLADPPPKKKPRRRASAPRRFERARAGELWQSDITSYVLRRHSTRVYLTVFLDDFSRYVVSWQLATQQRGALVSGALLEGIARFGKPREVLTDQGRQYFAWRGKSAFQKLLVREGIRHVVSRTHHPQTLGKCERLWKTISDELWERARPEDLAEARERLEHYFRHYNHFRPHQGIGGVVPADRFFGAESALRRTLEEQMGANELALALDETPRRPVFLFGQIGDRAVSLHGERGKLVIQTEEGGREELALGELGMAHRTNNEEKIDERREDDRRGDSRDDDRHTPDAAAADAGPAPAHVAQAHELPAAAPARPFGAGLVAGSERRGALQGAPAVHGGAGVLAGPRLEGDGRGPAGDDALARVAALPAGAVGDAGGPLAAAAQPGEARGELRSPRDRHRDPQAEDPGAGEETRTYGGPGAGAEAPAVEEGEREWSPCPEARRAQQRRAQEGQGAASNDEGSECGWRTGGEEVR